MSRGAFDRRLIDAKWHLLKSRWSSRPLCRRISGRVLPLEAWLWLPPDVQCEHCARIIAYTVVPLVAAEEEP